jgi:hypothetical protein
MFELSMPAAPPKLSVLKWLAVVCFFLGICFMLEACGYSLPGTLFVLSGNILGMVAAHQRKNSRLPVSRCSSPSHACT